MRLNLKKSGGLALEGGAPRAFGMEGQWGLSEELHRPGGNRDSILGGHTQGFMCTGSQNKVGIHKNLGQTYLWVLEGLLGKQCVAMAHCGGRILEKEVPGNQHQHELPWRLPF